jgi:hypothetical protein
MTDISKINRRMQSFGTSQSATGATGGRRRTGMQRVRRSRSRSRPHPNRRSRNPSLLYLGRSHRLCQRRRKRNRLRLLSPCLGRARLRCRRFNKPLRPPRPRMSRYRLRLPSCSRVRPQYPHPRRRHATYLKFQRRNRIPRQQTQLFRRRFLLHQRHH